MCRDSTKTGAHLDAIPYEGLLRDLTASPADVVVLVLDCCFSGTAGRVPLPERRPMALITSAKPLGRIGNGNGIDPTPFTAAVLRVLREGTSTHDPVTVGSLGIRLTELAADQAVPPSADHGPWVPTELSIGGAHNTVLSQARLGGTVPAGSGSWPANSYGSDAWPRTSPSSGPGSSAPAGPRGTGRSAASPPWRCWPAASPATGRPTARRPCARPRWNCAS